MEKLKTDLFIMKKAASGKKFTVEVFIDLQTLQLTKYDLF